MKTVLFVTTLCFSLIYVAFAQSEKPLDIYVNGIKVLEGQMVVAVFAESQKFLEEEAFKTLIKPVADVGQQNFRTTLPPGNYAISVYHDVNSDGELNTNFLGIPKEPYGFSNNARASFGPPKFTEASFTVEDKSQTITIDLQH